MVLSGTYLIPVAEWNAYNSTDKWIFYNAAPVAAIVYGFDLSKVMILTMAMVEHPDYYCQGRLYSIGGIR